MYVNTPPTCRVWARHTFQCTGCPQIHTGLGSTVEVLMHSSPQNPSLLKIGSRGVGSKVTFYYRKLGLDAMTDVTYSTASSSLPKTILSSSQLSSFSVGPEALQSTRPLQHSGPRVQTGFAQARLRWSGCLGGCAPIRNCEMLGGHQ